MEVAVPENHRAIWSNTEFKQLLKEVKKGLDFNTIANNHKRTIGAIKYKLIRHAIQLAEEDQTITLEHLCDITNLTKDDIVYGFEKLKFDYEYLIENRDVQSVSTENTIDEGLDEKEDDIITKILGKINDKLNVITVISVISLLSVNVGLCVILKKVLE